MSLDSHVADLISVWQQRRQEGEEVGPEDLCRHCPELLPELERQLEILRQMERLVGKVDTDGVGGFGVQQTADLSARSDPDFSQGDATLAERPNAQGSILAPPMLPGELGRVGDYRILSVLGRGGMGIVFKAEHVQLKRLVALKMVLAGQHARREELLRFRTEAQAVARLQHPNIIQIHEIGEHNELPYLTLEFCAGGTLATHLDGTPWQPLDAAQLIETLAGAVQAAHQASILHRDLKPANVLFAGEAGPEAINASQASQRNGDRSSETNHPASRAAYACPATLDLRLLTPKISDFGLAKKMDESEGHTQTEAVLGTPSYMSPEQAAGKAKELGPAADIYSLGAILYELLTGRPPFKAATSWDTVVQVINQEPVPPHQLQPHLPKDLETICLKCLQKEPGKRYPSAEALAQELRRFQNREPILARPVSALERSWRWCRRNPAVTALCVSLLVVLVAGLMTVTHLWLEAEDERAVAVKERQRAEDLTLHAQEQQAVAEKQTAFAQTQKALAEAESQRAQDEALKASREAAKASRIAHFLTEMYAAADPLGLNGIPMLRPKGDQALTARELLDYGAEKMIRELDDEPDVQAKLMDTIGNVYCTLGLPEKAEPLLTRALLVRRKTMPPNHPEFAATLHNLGWLQHQKGNWTAAEKLYQEALAIRRQHLKEDPIPFTVTVFNLGWLLLDKEDFAASERLFKQVVELRLQKLGEEHRDVAVARFGLASVFLAQGKLTLAIEPYLKARATLMKNNETKGVAQAIDLYQRGLMARELTGPARLLAGLGPKDSWETLFEQSLALTRKTLGDRHAFVGMILHDMASTYERRGQTRLAEQHYRECLVVARHYGLDHPKCAILLDSFSRFLCRNGKTADAVKLLREAEAECRLRSPDHYRLAETLLLVYELAPAKEKAANEALLREALAIFRKSPDASPRSLAQGLYQLGTFLDVTEPSQAEQLLQEARPLLRAKAGRRQHAWVLYNLARVQLSLGKYDEVEGLLKECLDLSRSNDPQDYPLHVDIWRYLGRLYLETQTPEKAGHAALQRRSLAVTNVQELYDVACDLARCAALAKTEDRSQYVSSALETLRQARTYGFHDGARLRADTSFESLRGEAGFQELLAELEKAPGRVRTGDP